MTRSNDPSVRWIYRRRVLLSGLPILGGGLLLLWMVVVGPVVSVGLAYKVKTLCSELFVANRSPHDVSADLEIDDLRLLRFVRAHVDPSERVVTARALMAKRQARFAEGLGCTLTPSPWLDASPPEQFASRGPSARISEPLEGSPATRRERNARLEQALDGAFEEAEGALPKRTRAVVVVHRGEIVAERYASGIGPETPLLGWSMTKSIMNALIGAAIHEGKLTLDEPTGLHLWGTPGDARVGITVSIYSE